VRSLAMSYLPTFQFARMPNATKNSVTNEAMGEEH
jgi:hypothetical protein